MVKNSMIWKRTVGRFYSYSFALLYTSIFFIAFSFFPDASYAESNVKNSLSEIKSSKATQNVLTDETKKKRTEQANGLSLQQANDAKKVGLSLAKAEKEGRKPSIYGATFPSSFALYVFNPDLLAGWNGPLRGYEKKWIPQKYQDIPILGGWYGQGMIPDNEVIYKAKPDASFILASLAQTSDAEKTMRKLGIPIIKIPGASIEDNINLFRSLGIALHQEERGEELSGYAEQVFLGLEKDLHSLKDEDRVRVYLSQGADGLETSCMGSARSVVIEAAGGINANKCPDIMKDQFVQLSFENLVELDPDVILVNNPSFMKKVRTDNRWQNLRAVKKNRIYNVPFEPFSWLDRPPSFMRFIGVQWLTSKLHPELFHTDLTQETKKFMKLFFGLAITDEQALKILNP